jgi:hypothetical protein
MQLTSTDLDLGEKTVGLRFAGISIPPGATILNAYVQFQADESNTGATALTISGQAADSAPTFTSASGNVTSRSRTAASVLWSSPAWTAGQAGASQRTPDIALVIEEIVNRPGWSNGNALVIILTGSGLRAAKSFETAPAGAAAPLLHIEYTVN